jgi:hypothetical protein
MFLLRDLVGSCSRIIFFLKVTVAVLFNSSAPLHVQVLIQTQEESQLGDFGKPTFQRFATI